MHAKVRITKQLLLSAIMMLSMILVACGSNGNSNSSSAPQAAKAPASKQVLIWPISGVQDVATLDAQTSQDVYSGQAISMLFNNMVTYNDKGLIVPDLALSYSVSPDSLTWTFHLRPNVKFSDGTPLTSADVVFSIDHILQPSTKATYGVDPLRPIKDADKLNAGKIKTIIGDSLLTPDPQTVVILTSRPAANFLDSMAGQGGYVIEKSFIQKYGDSWSQHLVGGGGGAGPWKLQSYTHGKNLVFVPNPYYYGKKPQLQKVVMPLYAVSDTTYKDYSVNRVDFAFVPTAQLAAARALPDGQYRKDPALNNSLLTLNYLTKPFDNIKIRQAFALAINKDLIATRIWKDTVIPTNHILINGVEGYNPNLTGPAGVKSTAGDPALAKKLFDEGLQEEGLTRATLPTITFELSSEGSADSRNMFAALQQMWQTVLNVPVKINDVDFNKMLVDQTPLESTQLMGSGFGWNGSPDPYSWMTIQFGAGASDNYQNFGQNHSSDAAQQQHAQQLMVQADATVKSFAERMKLEDEAEQIIVNDVGWLPLYQGTAVYVVKPCVIGWPHDPFGQFSVPYQPDWSSIYISSQGTCANSSFYQ